MSDVEVGGPGSRRAAREQALSILYESEMKDLDADRILAALDYEPAAFAVALVEGVARDRATLDEVVERYAIGWRVARMPVIDRTLLRIATFELTQTPDVPAAVVINEAVDLAKRYSTDDSGRFVNGVLASIAAARGDDEVDPGDAGAPLVS